MCRERVEVEVWKKRKSKFNHFCVFISTHSTHLTLSGASVDHNTIRSRRVAGLQENEEIIGMQSHFAQRFRKTAATAFPSIPLPCFRFFRMTVPLNFNPPAQAARSPGPGNP